MNTREIVKKSKEISSRYGKDVTVFVALNNRMILEEYHISIAFITENIDYQFTCKIIDALEDEDKAEDIAKKYIEKLANTLKNNLQCKVDYGYLI